ncbi:2-acylglycerol O-acyltransferase 1-like [Acropora palmata]|uniref:2-acylglycerol O-acyltransferase 1-like n=1 Tax=Acropora palmata TaxID=6131 RepID=UPI003DA0322D
MTGTDFINSLFVLLLYMIGIGGLNGSLPAVVLYMIYNSQNQWLLAFIILYVTWMFIDWRTPHRGGRKIGLDIIGASFLFRSLKDYFPITLTKTTDLDPKRNYIFGYHPHGVLPDGLVISFGTNLLGFQEMFPGITPHLGAHSLILKAPIIREIALWLRVVDVGLESCRYVLTKMGPGNSVAINIGGAAELLDSCHKDYILTLKRRKKFVKMALETGSPLVPIFGFGQHDKFLQPSFTNFEWLGSYKSTNRTFVEKWLKIFAKGNVIPFCGKCIPYLPNDKPVAVVVGTPIHVQRVESPNDEQIEQLHNKYVEGLKQLFEVNRDKYGVPRDTKLIIQ